MEVVWTRCSCRFFGIAECEFSIAGGAEWIECASGEPRCFADTRQIFSRALSVYGVEFLPTHAWPRLSRPAITIALRTPGGECDVGRRPSSSGPSIGLSDWWVTGRPFVARCRTTVVRWSPAGLHRASGMNAFGAGDVRMAGKPPTDTVAVIEAFSFLRRELGGAA